MSACAVIEIALGDGSADTTVVAASGLLFGNKISWPLDCAKLMEWPSLTTPVMILLEEDYDEKFY